MAIIRQVDVNNDVGFYWLSQYNRLINNIGYVGQDDSQLYFTETASANKLARTTSVGRLDYTIIPNQTYNGTLQITQGGNTTPSIFFSGNTNTGLYSPSANQVAITTNGIQALLIDSSQSITISGDLAVNGGDITTSASNFNLLTSASTVNVGLPTGTVRLASNITSTQSTVNLLNSTVTTANVLGAATNLNLANTSSSQTGTIFGGSMSSGTKVINIATGGTGSSTTTLTLGGSSSSSVVNIASPEFCINNTHSIECTTTSISTTAPTTIYSFDSKIFKSSVIRIDVYNGQNYYSSNIHVVHNGIGSTILSSDVQGNEYSVLSGGINPVANLSVQLSSAGGNVNLTLTANSATTSTIKISSHLTKF